MKYGIQMTAKKEKDDMIKILLDINNTKGSHDMTLILAKPAVLLAFLYSGGRRRLRNFF